MRCAAAFSHDDDTVLTAGEVLLCLYACLHLLTYFAVGWSRIIQGWR